ncbi:hypothetical protein GQ600_12482 [Phytophthora cactorum]|nr:hypothetical protein GQ600_12482 [Phytophthora cactorum]
MSLAHAAHIDTTCNFRVGIHVAICFPFLPALLPDSNIQSPPMYSKAGGVYHRVQRDVAGREKGIPSRGEPKAKSNQKKKKNSCERRESCPRCQKCAIILPVKFEPKRRQSGASTLAGAAAKRKDIMLPSVQTGSKEISTPTINPVISSWAAVL